jgi:RHS repeat-associated protein
MTRTYTYNAANQRTEVEHDNQRGPTQPEDTQRWAYGYDALGQVESATKQYHRSTPTAGWLPLPGYDQAFTHDDIGNRETATTNGRQNDYTSDALNRYLARGTSLLADVRGRAAAAATVLINDEVATRTGEEFYLGVPVMGLKENSLKIQAATATPHYAMTETRTVLVPAVPETFSYDLDGNLLQDGLWTYEWDAENRLIAQELRSDVSTSTWKRLEYSYDQQSRRIRKLVKTRSTVGGTWTTASDTRFLYDGWNLIAEYAYASSTFTLLRSHAWGSDLSGTSQGAGGVGCLFWTTVASTSKTYLAAADANGNIIAYVDCADGTVAGRRDYGAFGDAIIITGIAGSLPFGFSTKYEEKETGLYYYGFRYYNPSTGRWPSRDPIGERGGLNLYGMVNNDAINWIDALGLAQISYNVIWSPGTETDANKKRLKQNIRRLEKILDKCCKKFQICGITVSLDGGDGAIDLNLVPKETTIDPYNPNAIAHGREAYPPTLPTAGITWRIDAARQTDVVLAHETGHTGGYFSLNETDEEARNPQDHKHSAREGDFMYREDSGWDNVTKCSCEALARSAK